MKHIGVGLLLISSLFCMSVYAQSKANTEHFVELVGVLSQGSLLSGQVQKGVNVFLNDKRVHVTPEGAFVLGFGRDAKLTQKLRLEHANKTVSEQVLKLAKVAYKIQRIEGVPQKMVTPDPNKSARISAEASLVRTARKKNLDLEFFLKNFIAPSDGPITGVYGSQRVYNGTPKRPHYGVDYAGPVGKVVYAPQGGVVTLAHEDMYYSGGTLLIDHGYGVSSSFLHLSKILVNEGDSVNQGDPIAKIGQGGRSTGPHLDWRINWFNVRIDPQLVLRRFE